MSTRDDLLAATRALLTTVGGVPDGKLVHAGAKGPRPALPYVTLRVTSGGAGIGSTERLDGLDDDDAPVVTMRERREASVSIQGFGSGSLAWLEALQLGLDSPASLALQETNGVAAVLLAPVRDASELLDTAEESRFVLELTLRHRVLGTAASAVELLQATLSGGAERFDGDPTPLSVNTTVSTTAA